MKLLLFYAHKWWFKTASKSLQEVPDVQMEDSVENAVVVFYHAEKEDEEKSKASPEFSEKLEKLATERLQNTGYNVMCIPFGYFNEFLIHVGGESLAKVFKEF